MAQSALEPAPNLPYSVGSTPLAPTKRGHGSVGQPAVAGPLPVWVQLAIEEFGGGHSRADQLRAAAPDCDFRGSRVGQE